MSKIRTSIVQVIVSSTMQESITPLHEVRQKIGGILTWLHPKSKQQWKKHSFKTNSKRTLKIGRAPKGNSSSNHPFSGGFHLLLVSSGPFVPSEISWNFDLKAHQHNSLTLPKNHQLGPFVPWRPNGDLAAFPASRTRHELFGNHWCSPWIFRVPSLKLTASLYHPVMWGL